MDRVFMKEALELAEKARGFTKTNPLVGAIIVKDGHIVGRGFHRYYGGDHAEVMALKEAGSLAKGASIYVSLEPCCHFGKTPPCTQALIDAGIRKAFVAMVDPNPKVAGKGISILKNEGIAVEVGLLEDEAKWINRVFLKNQRDNIPYITLKYACSLDGKIASSKGESKWITSQASRLDGHLYRSMVDGILVGSRTALLDNPSLNNRSQRGEDPFKIILDRTLKLPLDYKIFRENPEKTLIFTSSNQEDKLAQRRYKGAKVFRVGEKDGHLDLLEILHKLYDLKLGHILVEGGGEVHDSFIRAGLFDEAILYYAPIFIGGKEAGSAVSGKGIETLSLAPRLRIKSIERIEEDIKIHGVKKCLRE